MSTETQVVITLVVLALVVVFFIVPQMKRWNFRNPARTRRVSTPRYSQASHDAAKAEMRLRNQSAYAMSDIPLTLNKLTLFRYYSEFRGEAVAGAYLYPDYRSRDECMGEDAPAPYYRHKAAIWSWDASDMDMSLPQLEAEARARFNRMLGVLEQNGWRSTSHDEQVTLYHLYRI